MAIRKSIKFRVPHSIEKVAEHVLKPERFISSLPLNIEVKSIQGDSIIAYLDAFGLKGEVILNFTTSKALNEVSVECQLIGEVLYVLGKQVYVPPKTGLSFKAVAVRAPGGTEVTFEVFIRSGLLKELSLHREAELFLSALPRALVSALETATVTVTGEVARPTSPLEADRAMVTTATQYAQYADSTQATGGAPGLSRESAEPAPSAVDREAALEREGLVVKDSHSALLENPVAVYRLLSSGQLLSVVSLDRTTPLSKALVEMSFRASSPIYVILRAKEWAARLLVDGGSILGVLVESGTQVIKGKEALSYLGKIAEGATCAVYKVSRDVLESLGNL